MSARYWSCDTTPPPPSPPPKKKNVKTSCKKSNNCLFEGIINCFGFVNDNIILCSSLFFTFHFKLDQVLATMKDFPRAW